MIQAMWLLIRRCETCSVGHVPRVTKDCRLRTVRIQSNDSCEEEFEVAVSQFQKYRLCADPKFSLINVHDTS